MKTSHTRFWCVAALLALMAPGARSAPPDKGPTTSEQALAMRLAEMAQRSLQKKNLIDADFQRAADLLEAARRCDPAEVRYPRLQAEALRTIGDRTGAIDAVTALRKLRPDDRGADLDLIDLYASGMETLDARIAYFRSVIDRDAVPREVRSAIAIRCAGALHEKARDDEATALVDKALELNPLNLPALRWRLAQAPATTTLPQRMSMMAAIVRSDPGADPVLLVDIARILAGQGLPTESLQWFQYATAALNAARIQAPPGTATDLAAEMILAGQNDLARGFLDQTTKALPGDVALRELLYLLQQPTDEKAADLTLQQARTALINQLETVRGQLKITGAATRPANDSSKTIPDLSRDADALKPETKPEIRGQYLQALADLAWFEVYFDNRPEEASRLISQFQSSAPKEADKALMDQFAARVIGWVYLKQGKADEAHVKLSAAAGKDPLAGLGLVKLEKDPARAKTQAAKLLSTSPAGLNGAIIFQALRDQGVKVQPAPGAADVQAALASAPREWMNILANPRRFYSMRPEPAKVIYAYVEPMLVKVTLQNTSEFDLTVGDQGVIGKKLIFNALIGGVFGQSIVPSVCVEDLDQQLILHPRQSISLIVRLDQGNLAAFMMANPTIPITITGSMVSNPIEIAPGKPAQPGPAGYGMDFPRIMERSGFAISEDSLRRLIEQARNASGPDRIRLIESMALLSTAMRSGKEVPPPVIKAADNLLQEVDAARQDKDPSIRAYASFWYAAAVPEGTRGGAVQKMLLPDSPWQERLLGLTAMLGLPRDRQIMMAQDAAKDPDATVRKFALASVEMLKHPPATQPSTQPAKAP